MSGLKNAPTSKDGDVQRQVTENVALMAFDILELDGSDMRPLPLAARKIYLWKLLSRNKSSNLAAVPSFEDGEQLMLAHSLEGVVSKRKSAPMPRAPGQSGSK